MLVCNAFLYVGFFERIYMRVYKNNGHILGNKNPTKQERTQVYVTKKTHVYRVIILKQMADRTLDVTWEDILSYGK